MTSGNLPDFRRLARACVQALQPYVPGKPVEELERELGISGIVKLASNENPLGPSPSVLQAIQNALPDITRYPDGNAFTLKNALSQHYNIDKSRITIGNGSNDVLELIARAFADESREIIYSQFAFAVYPIVTQAIGARAVEVPASDWGHDLNAMLEAVTEKTAIIFIANPNNPTGTWLKQKEITDFLTKIPSDVLVVLDEAYCEYMTEPDYPDGLALMKQFSNLVVTRTFSKAYGLAALRVGYAVANEGITDMLNRVRQPFNGNSIALCAAVAALQDRDYVEQSRDLNQKGLTQLENGLHQLGFDWIPSVGNFITFDVGQNAGPLFEFLLGQGVIVRPVANYGMPNHLRVSVGLESENQKFIDALGAWK